LRPFHKTFENRNHKRTNIGFVCAPLMRLIEGAPPLIELEERGARPKTLGPGRWEGLKSTAATGGVSEQPAHAVLAEPVQQDIGERRAGLAFS